MRWVTCALVLLALPSRAVAADLDIFRPVQPVGPANFANWSGVYVGGQFGLVDTSADFSKATAPPIAYALRETTLENDIKPSDWPVLGTADHHATSFGGYIGYNSQWQDLILGIEGNYNHTSISLIAPSSTIARQTPADSAGNVYDVQISATGKLTNFDYGTIRARAGWVFDNFFLPYGFLGLAVGKADVSILANVDGVQNPPTDGGPCLSTNTPACVPFSFSANGGKNSEVLYGFAGGVGMDVALTQNVFLRGEYEYVRFVPINDTLIAVSNFRAGLGFKF